ncbi:MAG: hypothetical protein R3C53_17875 [Pirellulaceae bacterium]
MIFFWLREIAGWLLVLFALYLVRQGLVFAMDLETPRIIEAAVLVFGGIGVMRIGVLLIRMATAARICQLPS